MKRLFISALLGLSTLFTCQMAVAEEITFYTGAPGKGYHKATIGYAQRLEQRGHEVTIENRKGSDDITLQACNAEEGEVVAWIAQLDAMYTREMNTGCVLVETAQYSMEYAMLWFPPRSKNNELSDLGEGDKILIDAVGSGSDLSIKVMKQIEKEFGRGNDWIKTTSVFSDIKRATTLASRNKIQAVFMVRTPYSKDVDMLLKAGWTMGELYDKDINDQKWNDQPLYNDYKLAIIRGGKLKSHNWVYEVPTYIGTTESVEFNNPDLFDDIIEATN